MKNYLVLLIFIISPTLAGANIEAPEPDMFAYGTNLEINGRSPFYYCELPLDIYRSTVRHDLGDLRVFNGKNKVVPHALKRPDTATEADLHNLRAEIPFFPLTGPVDRELKDLSLHVEKNAAGTIIDVSTKDGEQSSSEKRIIGYLLDTTDIVDHPHLSGRFNTSRKIISGGGAEFSRSSIGGISGSNGSFGQGSYGVGAGSPGKISGSPKSAATVQRSRGQIVSIKIDGNPSQVRRARRIQKLDPATNVLPGTKGKSNNSGAIQQGPRQTAFGRLPIQALEFTWDNQKDSFLGKINIATSHDLISWTPLTNGNLGRMDHLGYSLDLRKIELPPGVKTYIRLTWPNEQPPINITQVMGLATATPVQTPRLNWNTATYLPDPDQSENYNYDLGSFLPVEKIKIRLPDQNTMAVATVSSADSPEGPYVSEWQGLLYHLVKGEGEIINPEIPIASSSRRYWQVTLADSEAGPNTPPTMDCGWQADQLIFIAQGNGPFRIFYGSAEIQPADFEMNKLLTRYQRTTNEKLAPVAAHIGSKFIQGGESKLQPLPPPPPWRKYLLWFFMVSGVAVIGWMSLSLYRQLQLVDKSQ